MKLLIDRLIALLYIDRSVEGRSTTPGTEARIRDAALRLFAARGYAATGIRDVARDAGVTTAALYHYMGGKQDLLLTIMRDGMHGLLAEARIALREATTPREELAALARVHIVFNGRKLLDAYVGDTEIRSLDDANRARVVKLRDEYEELWADVIRRGVESGDFRITDQKLFRLAAIQMVNGVAYWYRPTGERALMAIADEFAGFALAMAGCPTEGDVAAGEGPVVRGSRGS
jgi:TetR/AcrR family transcriptional regulator, cholesterol catabolism regulator